MKINVKETAHKLVFGKREQAAEKKIKAAWTSSGTITAEVFDRRWNDMSPETRAPFL